ncbi:hypothetical protein GCM10023340_34880 [Nocardioides marinquilinus]|uniref:Uncharacterized protein n=1 Tax=Nocardioides marinquilinus TaxID=1210400 RepID=A0ABP9PZ78_9ACTN
MPLLLPRAGLALALCLALVGLVTPTAGASSNPPRLSTYISGTSDTGKVTLLACQRRNPTSGNIRIFARIDNRKSRASATATIAIVREGEVVRRQRLETVAERARGPVTSFVVADRPGLRSRVTLTSGSGSSGSLGPLSFATCG